MHMRTASGCCQPEFWGMPSQRMITAHHHAFRGYIRHNHRSGLLMDLTGEGTMWPVDTRLAIQKVDAHAWCMVVAQGILLPVGVIWARYFRVSLMCTRPFPPTVMCSCQRWVPLSGWCDLA